ncbi:sigma-70 family RNA polymerase sigma factor [Enteractinococcus helveticum]|uniref:RNA polymerase subunit sigma-70 n=1 Tax=Enteractinococcus helveticum TaxID=1837282 RepID=A0A1B7LV43_9MICC|nr:sigma-70 family RNA polymerase sigma factor [Enteractinococcus helveticum]OAV51885.1 hypothetical protein A6F49_01405 [Enteractinococcus helveticum]
MQKNAVSSIDYRTVVSNFEFAELYEWQRRALQAWSTHNFRGVIEAVTGAGKTRVGVAAIAQALRVGMKVTVLVPTSELQDQWTETLRRDLQTASIGRLGGNHTADFRDVDVIVAIINSASARSVIDYFRSGLVVADECHRYAAPFFASALEENYTWRLGLTATYTRNDGQNEILDEYFGPIVYRIWYKEAQRYDVISKFDIALVGIYLLPNEQSAYDDLSEKIRVDTLSLRNYIELHSLNEHDFMEAIGLLAQRDDASAEGAIARRYLKNVADRQQLLANTVVKNHALAALAPAVDASERTLVFGSSKNQAHAAAQTLEAVGVPAGSLMSGMSKVDRLGTMNAFRRGDLQALCAPRVLDEGVDVPAADLAIQTSGSRVQRQFIQRLGRVIRKRPSGDRGRFVYLYAFGTIEDPARQERFLPDVLPYARNYMYFDLEKHLEELIEFLAPQPNESPRAEIIVDRTAEVPESSIDVELSSEGPQQGPRWNDIFDDDEDRPKERLRGIRITDDALGDYLAKIGRYELLADKEMVELAQQVEAGLYAEHILKTNFTKTRRERRDYWSIVERGEHAFQKMVNANLKLVVSVAKKYSWLKEASFGFLDLIQEGNIGLLRGIQLWDYKKGFQFSTYAYNWIWQAMSRSMADSSRTIRLPVHVVEQINKINKTRQELISAGEPASDEQVAVKLKVEPAKVRSVLEAEPTIVSLSRDCWVDGIPYGLSELIVDPTTLEGGDYAVERIYRQELREALDIVVSYWTDRDQDILYKRAGITTLDAKAATLDAIGRDHGVTRERIRQIETQLRESLADNGWLKSIWNHDQTLPPDPAEELDLSDGKLK